VRNTQPIIMPRGIHHAPITDDQYFKGALFLNTLRIVIDDDTKWFTLIHDVFQHFKYKNIMTEDMVAFIKLRTGESDADFRQYLRHAALPALELSSTRRANHRLQVECG
jgi:aminopeptidase N